MSANSGEDHERTFGFENGLRFSAVSDTITYVGLIEIKTPNAGFAIKRNSTKILLKRIMFEWACSKDAEIFEKMSVRFVENAYDGKPVKINCET